jgi:hypothetical protein
MGLALRLYRGLRRCDREISRISRAVDSLSAPYGSSRGDMLDVREFIQRSNAARAARLRSMRQIRAYTLRIGRERAERISLVSSLRAPEDQPITVEFD